MLLAVWSLAALAAVLLYIRSVYSRFNRHGVKCLKPLPFFGNIGRIITRQEHFSDHLGRLYRTYPGERFVGRYEFTNPIIMLRDLELIKLVTVKDFEHFLDHRVSVDEKIDPFFGRNLFSLKGQEWKDMRSTLSPAFTSSKIRLMVPLMVEVGDIMIKSIKERIQNSSEGHIDVDCKDLMTRYANDVIASCAFGLKVDSHTDRDNRFYAMGKVASTFNLWQLFKLFAISAWPLVAKALRFTLFTKSTRLFFWNLVLGTMSEREAKHIIRPDMIQLLMDAKRGRLKHEDKYIDTDAGFATAQESSVGRKNTDRVWTDSHFVAQAMLFLIAGFETVSSAMCFALHELAINPDIQQRLLEEIKEHEVRSEGTFDYSSIQKLKYLDMVVSEVLRKWPPVVSFDRLCIKDYNLGAPSRDSSQNYTIRKGESVITPVWPIHRDPDFYPEPEKFDPERFSEGKKDLIKPFTYIPFGLGPRNCIGSRFALCEVKVMLYQLLLHVELSPCEKTCTPAVLTPGSFNINLRGGHWLRFRLRQNVSKP